MILSQYVDRGSVLDSFENIEMKIGNIFKEIGSLPNFHHIFFKARIADEFVCTYQAQDINNKGLNELRSFNGDIGDIIKYYKDMVEYLTYGDAYFRVQLLPSIIFVIENRGKFPYQLEISSPQITSTILGEWLYDPSQLNIKQFINELPFGLQLNGFIANNESMNFQPLHSDVLKETTSTKEDKAKKLLDELNKISDMVKNKQKTEYGLNLLPLKDEEVLNTSEKDKGLELDKIFQDVNKHVEASKDQTPETVPLVPDETPINKAMEEIIESRNNAKMDVASDILKNALETGANPFESSPSQNPYDKRNRENATEDPMSDIEYDN